MLRQIGKALWRQTREITVSNHSTHLVYAIPVNGGTLSICQNKQTDRVEWIQTHQKVQTPVSPSVPVSVVDLE